MLRLGLEIADRVVAALPSRAAYALADLAGDAWYRLAPARRRLVAANLARVCAATGRPVHGRPFRELVRSAFRNHARYYVELLRAPHYPVDRIDEIMDVPRLGGIRRCPRAAGQASSSARTSATSSRSARSSSPTASGRWSRWRRSSRRRCSSSSPRGAAAAASSWCRSARARRQLSQRLRAGGTLGIIGDRDLAGDGHPVTMFGHPTTVPLGPAALAVAHGAALVVGRCLRIGPDRFRAEGEVLEVPSSGDRRADAIALATRIAARFERDIGEAPEQWWGAFQPFWPDLRGESTP